MGQGKRISNDEYYLNIAKTVLERSTCLRRKYGAVIVNNDEVVSTGYNGAPRGEANCIDTGRCYREENNIPKGQMYEACMSGDTMIKLPGGECNTLKNLAVLNATDFGVYCVDTSNGSIVTSVAKISRVTGYFSKLLRITLSNGKSIDCTHNHRILMENCTYKKAEDIKSGDSIMSMDCSLGITRQGMTVVCTEEIDYEDYVYDLYVPGLNNFAVSLGDNNCVFVHNCVAVHAEQNAIISASRKDMIGATIYIVGKEVKTEGYADPTPCLICRRMIRNAGIVKCIGLVDGKPKEIELEV